MFSLSEFSSENRRISLVDQRVQGVMREERRLRHWRPAVKRTLRDLLLALLSRRSRVEGLTLR